MSVEETNNSTDGFSFTSSIKEDVWSGEKSGPGYEWWYFDALSDDASEAVVIIFLDNFVFSPRYNSLHYDPNGDSSDKSQTFPAVAFTYYRDGKPLYRAIAEFERSSFEASKSTPSVKMGKCSLDFKTAPYGTGYEIKIDLPLTQDRRIKARFEWLSIESDLLAESGQLQSGHCWNLVAPRSDVTGQITIIDRRGKRKKTTFRGTGYHDHNSDKRWMPDSIHDWFWGRVHFPFATLVFYRYLEANKTEPCSKLLVIREGTIEDHNAEFDFSGTMQRNKFGLSYPSNIKIHGEGLELDVKFPSAIDSSFFYLRFLSGYKLLENGQLHESAGISEYLRPVKLKNRWLDHLINLRIGRNGKSAFLP